MTTPLCCSWRATVAATLIAMSVGCAPRAAPDRFFTIGDVRLRYREIGRGEPVVLLHGATRSLEDWAGFGDSLAVDHRVIALDLRGHGQSSKFTERPGSAPRSSTTWSGYSTTSTSSVRTWSATRWARSSRRT
jgi:pimeloyl-ACP methyl ester carboxylesterase